ncbi:MAG: hypothetical protein GY953_36100, partial [bacterium]|nr:hypothetical protein [bacterium]
GRGLGPDQGVGLETAEDGRVTTELEGTQVLFDGIPGPLLYVQDRQINAVPPFAIAGRGRVRVEISVDGQSSQSHWFEVGDEVPAIFTIDSSGNGHAAVVNQDGTVNSPSNPASRGSIVAFYATGGGAFTLPLTDGEVVSGPPFPALDAENMRAYFEDSNAPGVGVEGELMYLGAAPGLVAGVVQINVRVPEGATP